MELELQEITQDEIHDFLVHKIVSKNLQLKIKLINEQLPSLSRTEALELLLDYLEN